MPLSFASPIVRSGQLPLVTPGHTWSLPPLALRSPIGLVFQDGVYFALEHIIEVLYDIFAIAGVWRINLEYCYWAIDRVESGT